MHVATVFERRRLVHHGVDATIFDPDDPRSTDAVFDVSTTAAIGLAFGTRPPVSNKRSKRYGYSESPQTFQASTF